MKIKHAINTHKFLTFAVVLGLMVAYDNFTIAAWVYLALHGTYGLMWLVKDSLYPDRRWETEISIPKGIAVFLMVGLYWIAPFILISNRIEPPSALIAAAIAINITGIVLHYGSDAQKYFTLKYKRGLITEGFFSRTRNPNYLGEILTYISFALLTQHWLPFVVVGFFAATTFIPNMLKKDESLSRYPKFAEYKARTGMLLPNPFGGSKALENATFRKQESEVSKAQSLEPRA